MHRFVLSLCLLFVFSLCHANPTLTYPAPILTSPPVIDGTVSPGEWEKALSFDGMRQHGKNKLEWRSAKSFIAADEQAIYLAIQTELPSDGSLVTQKQGKNVQACFEDIVEFFIDPNPDAIIGITYHLLLNAAGLTAFDSHIRGKLAKPNWKQAGVVVKGARKDGLWTVEASFPLTLFKRPLTGSPWSISLCRSWMRPMLFSSAPGLFNGHDVRITFSAEAPSLAFRWNRDPFTKIIDTSLWVTNNAPDTQAYTLDILLTNNHMPDLRKHEMLQLKPQERKSIRFKAKLTGNTCTDFDLALSLKDRTGEEIFPLSYQWNVPLRKQRWRIVEASQRNCDFELAYYPYGKKLRIEPILRNFRGKLPEYIPVELRRRADDSLVWKDRIPAVDGKISTFTLPELNGEYQLMFKVPGTVVKKPLVRKHFAWENNQLGCSRKVYAPFTDMTVKDKVISTVLRRHHIAETGLPRQIEVKGVKIMTSGMRLMTADGEVTGKLTFKETSPDRIRTSSELTGKNFTGHAEGRWEYDGTLKYDLTIQPGKLSALTLEIPLDAELCPLAYAGIMRNISLIRLPSHDGLIWRSTDVPLEKRMPQGFCTYLYLGSPWRGLCFFAENDRNWGWREGTPNLTIVRQGKTAILKVHLVNAPLDVMRPRTLSFGLLAAPVKPRPKDWAVRWSDQNYSVLGTDVNWLGGPGCCACVYPPGRKTIFWESLAQANVEAIKTPEQKAARKELSDRLIDIASEYFKPFDAADYQKSYNHHVYHRILRGASYGRKMIFYYNRSVYNGLDEYPTFMNEWTTADFETRNYLPSINEIFIVPSKSYIDYSLYWHKKSFQYRNHGIYWDNMLLVPSYNTEMTEAYRRSDGTIVPATGIWALRSLVKRAFVMMNEEGLPPVTLPHMTSLSLLPILSFATFQLDWEWKYSAGPVQTRFSPDYCQLVSYGELPGVIPLVCSDSGPQASRKDIRRSFAGVTAVHMLDRYNSTHIYRPGCPLTTLNRAIYTRYLHAPDVKTIRYWDEDKGNLVTVDNQSIAWIAHLLPQKQAVLVLCSYSDAPQQATIGFPPGWSASDFESQESLGIVKPGTLKLSLPPYSVRAVEFKKP